MSKPIALIFGAGKRIGASTAEMLASKGYRVALAARSLKSQNSTEDSLHLTTDLSNPESVTSAFATLRKQWGEPSVVVYNGGYSMPVPHPKSKAALTTTLYSRCCTLHQPRRPNLRLQPRLRSRPCNQHHLHLRRGQRSPSQLQDPPILCTQDILLHRQPPQQRSPAALPGPTDSGRWQGRFSLSDRVGRSGARQRRDQVSLQHLYTVLSH